MISRQFCLHILILFVIPKLEGLTEKIIQHIIKVSSWELVNNENPKSQITVIIVIHNYDSSNGINFFKGIVLSLMPLKYGRMEELNESFIYRWNGNYQ